MSAKLRSISLIVLIIFGVIWAFIVDTTLAKESFLYVPLLTIFYIFFLFRSFYFFRKDISLKSSFIWIASVSIFLKIILLFFVVKYKGLLENVSVETINSPPVLIYFFIGSILLFIVLFELILYFSFLSKSPKRVISQELNENIDKKKWFSWGILVILLLLFWPGAIIYMTIKFMKK